jgi:RNA polymerase sigma-70 factor, ECF subfamily
MPASTDLRPPQAPAGAAARSSDQEISRPDGVVQRAKAGDAEAMAWLYEQHAPRLQRYFFCRLGGRVQQAEDLTAEVFVRTLERLDSYECRGLPFGAWLFRVARNLLVDHQRGQPREAQLALEECEEVDTPAAARDLDQVVDQCDLARAMRRLTPEQREILELRFIQGRSIAETQALTGRTEESVKKLQARGLQKLREWLLAFQPEPSLG